MSNKKDNQVKYKAPALEKGLDILEFLALHSTPQSQAEIAIGLEKSPNELYRMLASLESRGYIHRDLISSKYSLTLKLYYLSHNHSLVDKLRTAALQPMRDASLIIKQPCHLSVIYDNKVLVIAYSKSPTPIAVMIGEGNLYALSPTASGKILLAFSNSEERDYALDYDPEFKNLNQKEKEKYLQELKSIYSKGYCEMPSSYAQGVVNFSIPIGNTPRGVLASLTVSKLVTLKPEDKVTDQEIIEQMKICKQKIEANLGINL